MLGFHKYKTSANLGLHPCLARHNRPLHKPTILKMYDWKERGIGHLEILLKVWSQTTVQTGLLAAEEDGCMTFLTLSKTTKAALKKKNKNKNYLSNCYHSFSIHETEKLSSSNTLFAYWFAGLKANKTIYIWSAKKGREKRLKPSNTWLVSAFVCLKVWERSKGDIDERKIAAIVSQSMK